MKTIPLKQFTEDLQRRGGRAVGGGSPVRVRDGSDEFVVLTAEALDAENLARAAEELNGRPEDNAGACRAADTPKIRLTGVIEREDDWYVSLCPELNVASQGATIEEARANLIEALELFFECASAEEVDRRKLREAYRPPWDGLAELLAYDADDECQPGGETYFTQIEIAHG